MINRDRIERIKQERKIDAVVDATKSSVQRYTELDKTSVSIEVLKEYKMAQLKELCQEDIYSGFTATVGGTDYFFSFDAEAQANFTGSVVTIATGLITSIPEWTVKLNGEYTRINMTVEEFKEVALHGFYIKDQKIAKLRNVLEPSLKKAKTIEEVDSIIW